MKNDETNKVCLCGVGKISELGMFLSINSILQKFYDKVEHNKILNRFGFPLCTSYRFTQLNPTKPPT